VSRNYSAEHNKVQAMTCKKNVLNINNECVAEPLRYCQCHYLRGVTTMRICEAQLCQECRQNNGTISGDRASNPRVKYCQACSLLIRSHQSTKWKRARRSVIGWRAYQEEYSTYVNPEEKRDYHRHYLRRWRAMRLTGVKMTNSK
jgi:hypothetical protein